MPVIVIEEPTVDVFTIDRLTREMKQQAREMPPDEARYLVDAYYQVQHYRIQSGNQLSAGERATDAPPYPIVDWVHHHLTSLEGRIKALLGLFADGQIVGQWAQSQKGIGPVLSAGLLAHIDIGKAPTVGHIWNFAGLNPGIKWEKGQKRPWNAQLKVLCWKVGESFVKVSGMEDAYYGRAYAERKAYEQQRNDAGELADQAAAVLQAKRIGKDTKAREFYEQGKLPPAHIHARACRWTVKLFLSHWHAVQHLVIFGTPAPEPYAIAHLGHAHLLEPPGWPM